ncbi:MAG: hypothetical protein COA97_11110 [Flavobacteriales bacterium]|nr:MAG: hypothetical protein COA97_11110 [Flavobacteriales bacterium]
MKKTLILLLYIISLSVGAQTIERETISSNGNFYSNSVGQLSITLGEPVIATVSSGSNTLTQGFQQTKISVTGIEDYQTDFIMNVFPNPVSDFITIKLEEITENINYSIYTVESKMVVSNKITELETKLNISHLAKGNYFLKITQQNKTIKTYKIIKQ